MKKEACSIKIIITDLFQNCRKKFVKVTLIIGKKLKLNIRL